MAIDKKIKVYVGMSGGVDSSLSAALLKQEGYDVVGVYMKNWTQDMPGAKCPWAYDLADAKRVAVKLGIDFKVFDFENEYKSRVVDYMVNEYKAGRTPNPDIMCNQEVKFKLFLETALEDGADMIATGHYARVLHFSGDSSIKSPSLLHATSDKGTSALLDSDSRVSVDVTDESHFKISGYLKQAVDEVKDQTYFLYRVTGEALGKTLFPIGEYTKKQVRKMATELDLITANKKDSQGICFVGQVGIQEFLGQYVKPKPGNIVNKQTGKILGVHNGAIFYTIGQRHGLDVGGGLPYYVVGKDMTKNEVYVTTDLNDDNLWKKDIELTDTHWINQKPKEGECQIRVRHRSPLINAKLSIKGDKAQLRLEHPQRAIASGQSVVIYNNDICLGGGIVA